MDFYPALLGLKLGIGDGPRWVRNIQLFRERLSENWNLHATILKGNMGYAQYTCIRSCRTYFCWFPLAHKHTSMASPAIREFKIEWLRTMTTVKHATAHDQNHVTVHSFRLVVRLRWVVELFRVGATTENILPPFCRLGDSRIWSFRKKRFNSPVKWEGSEICKLCPISAQIYSFNILEPLKVVATFLSKTKISLAVYTQNSDWRPRTEIMEVIYFLFALKKFQCLFEVISVSFCLCNLCLFEFLYRICWMKMIY